MNTNYRAMAVEMGRMLYSKFPWRLVRAPDGYYAHYHAKAHAASTLEAFQTGIIPVEDQVMGSVVGITLGLKRYMYPTYYVGHEFIEAMYRSKLPDMPPRDLKMPFPALILGLPVQFSLNVFKRHVPYIYVARLGVGEDYLGQNSVTNRTAKLGVNAVVYNGNGREEPVNYYAGALDDEPVSNFDSAALPFTTNSGEELPEDHEINQLLVAIAVKCIMAASARPDLVESTEVCIQKERMKTGKHRPELWAPRWIGRTYRIKRITEHQGGTHASPVAHFRNGHLRNQPYGPKNVEYRPTRSVWIEPVLINAA